MMLPPASSSDQRQAEQPATASNANLCTGGGRAEHWFEQKFSNFRLDVPGLVGTMDTQ